MEYGLSLRSGKNDTTRGFHAQTELMIFVYVPVAPVDTATNKIDLRHTLVCCLNLASCKFQTLGWQ